MAIQATLAIAGRAQAHLAAAGAHDGEVDDEQDRRRAAEQGEPRRSGTTDTSAGAIDKPRRFLRPGRAAGTGPAARPPC